MAFPKLVLASTSPRRRELIKLIVDDFDVCSPSCEETSVGAPQTVALNNSILKGKSVKGDFVIACDTIVCLDNKIYGKGEDFDKAFSMLKSLNGKTHDVISGVYVRYNQKEYSFTDTSKVTFKNLSDEEITNYINTYKPFDKAGSYGIQDKIVVEKYEGSLYNIIGLPVEKLQELLKDIKND